MSTRDASLRRAGKMFSACGKNVFYIIDRTAGSRWRGPAPRHGLAAEGMAWRPTATACGRDPPRPGGRTATACGRTPCGRQATPWRAIMHRNQDQGAKARGRRWRGNHAPQSSLAAGPWRWRAQSCLCPCLAGSCSCAGLLLRTWLLRLGLCLGLSGLPVIRSRPGVPEHCEAVLGARADMGRPLRGLRPGTSGRTHYASLRGV